MAPGSTVDHLEISLHTSFTHAVPVRMMHLQVLCFGLKKLCLTHTETNHVTHPVYTQSEEGTQVRHKYRASLTPCLRRVETFVPRAPLIRFIHVDGER